jgi:glycosyltransferase involved in cell wall biosynthesis
MAEVTVVIPTLNCGKFVRNALDSVLIQSLQDFEIIVVDDGSVDDTRNTVKSYLQDPRIHYVYQSNRGVSKARNQGISLSRSKYIAFLDADDALLPQALSTLHTALEQRQDVSWCVTDVIWVRGQDVTAPDREIIRTDIHEDLYYDILQDNFKIGRPIFFKRDVLMSIGMYDEQLETREDWELNIRLVHKKIPFRYIREPLYLYHLRDGSLTKNINLILGSTESVMQKHHKILADRGDRRVARVYAQNLWDLGRRYFYQMHNVPRAMSCIARSLRYDIDLARLVHAIFHRLQIFWTGGIALAFMRISRADVILEFAEISLI